MLLLKSSRYLATAATGAGRCRPGRRGSDPDSPITARTALKGRRPSAAGASFTVGMSRARDLLVVCGDLDEIGQVGGKELRKRLAHAAL